MVIKFSEYGHMWSSCMNVIKYFYYQLWLHLVYIRASSPIFLRPLEVTSIIVEITIKCMNSMLTSLLYRLNVCFLSKFICWNHTNKTVFGGGACGSLGHMDGDPRDTPQSFYHMKTPRIRTQAFAKQWICWHTDLGFFSP